MKKPKISVHDIIDMIFYFVYIALFIISIFDLFDLQIPFIETYTSDSNSLLKFVLLVFSCVGVTILNDKRNLEKKVVNPIKNMDEIFKHSVSSNTNLFYFNNKKDDYDFFAREIRQLYGGAEVLVTSFDKNQSTNYYTGEDKHTEALMDDYTKLIKSGSIEVKQMVHVCTKKECEEVGQRAKLYKDCKNYSLSVMVGLPLRPYIDFVVINKETVMLSFSNDKSSPYNEAFSIAIKDSEIALQFEKYFNLYWNNDCRIIKGNDGIKESELEWLESVSLDHIVDIPQYTKYTILLLNIIISLKSFENIDKLISLLHQLTYQDLYQKQRELAKKNVDKLYSDLNSNIMEAPIEMTWNDCKNFLLGIYNCVQKKIVSTVILKSDDFWEHSNCFEELENILIKAGKNVEQILICTDNDSEKYKHITKQLVQSGAEVHVIVDNNIADYDYDSFLVIDEALVIEFSGSNQVNSFINNAKISEYKSEFDTMKKSL